MKANENAVHAMPEAGRVAKSLAFLDAAIEKYKPAKIIGLFSGGHDSTTAVHVAARHPQFSYAVHINTGIGVPATRVFVRETAARQGWHLREYHAADCGQDYRQIVKEHGFPGPGRHSMMYRRLKERALRVALKEAKSGYPLRTNIIFISGVRQSESTRRMGYDEPVTKDGSKIWVNIIHDWSKADCNRYLDNSKIQRSAVVDKIHKSGECLCGAYASPGEAEELEFWFPEVMAEIRSMEINPDVPAERRAWGWGCYQKRRGKNGPLCAGCARPNAALDALRGEEKKG